MTHSGLKHPGEGPPGARLSVPLVEEHPLLVQGDRPSWGHCREVAAEKAEMQRDVSLLFLKK